jgi:hypothetical protein
MIGQMTVQSEALAGVVQEQECISSMLARPSPWRALRTPHWLGVHPGGAEAEEGPWLRAPWTSVSPIWDLRNEMWDMRRQQHEDFCFSVLPRQSLPLSADFMGSTG